MRYQELLEYNNRSIVVDKFITTIKKNCSEIIDIYKETNKVLYRGSRKYPSDCFKGTIRQDRRPMSTYIDIQEMINEYLSKQGFSTNRSNCLFCSSTWSQAMIYGRVFIIFPKNGFHFLYSDKDDLFSGMCDYICSKLHMSETYARAMKPDEYKQAAMEYIQQRKFSDIDLATGIRSGDEIMISGTEYYAIAAPVMNVKELFNALQ